MRRIDALIDKLIKEERYLRIGNIACASISCNDCPMAITNGKQRGCEGVSKLGKWLTEETQEETYTERVITAYDRHTTNGIDDGCCDNFSEEISAEFTYIIRNKEDEREAKEKELSLREFRSEVKVQDFIHEQAEVLPWDKE